MRRSVPSLVAALSALGLATACGTTTTTTPSTPVATVDVHTQILSTNGAVIFPFTEATAGTVTATLTTVAPDSGLSLAMDLGTWDGSSCSIVISTIPAVQGAVATGTANAGGSLCVRVTDPNAVITSTESITVTISHF